MSNSAENVKLERWVVFSLFAVQFTHVCDFVIMMPLGPHLMRVFGIGAAKFGLLVSSYTLSAGCAGFVGALFVDRFDRKKVLLTLYLGFLIGTLCCGLASSYHTLLLARVVSGAFGGTLGATVFAIIGDVIHESRRGTATGLVMSAFPSASVLGVPVGLALADRYHWPAPFFTLAGLGLIAMTTAFFLLPGMAGHLKQGEKPRVLRDLKKILSKRNHWWAFSLGMSVMFPGFMVVPFISPYLVANVGIAESDLAIVYFCGGLCTFFSARFLGRLSDLRGPRLTFALTVAIATLPMYALTHLPTVTLPWVVLVTSCFMMFVSGRLVSAMHLITSSARPSYRGSFLSVNASLQQFALGVASLVGSRILVTEADGSLSRFGVVGWVAIGLMVFSVWISRQVQPIS